LRPMTQQDINRNNLMISKLGDFSVPIVSQTEIGPNENGPFPHSRARHDDGAHRGPPVVKPQSPGGDTICPRNWSNRAKETGPRALIDDTPFAWKVAMESTVEQCTALTIGARVAALRLRQ
jgi:hypothetical protein